MVVGACNDSTTAPTTSSDAVGSYTLQTINGQKLPLILINVSNAYFMSQSWGDLTLHADKTYVERDSVRERIVNPQLGDIVHDTLVTIRGVWEAQDSVITLTQTDNVVLFGVSRPANLTLTWVSKDSAFTYIYTRK